MMSHDSFPEMLNGIFKEANDAAKTRISYSIEPRRVRVKSHIRLEGVNGYGAPISYAKSLFIARANLIRKFNEAQASLNPQEKIRFVRQAVIRCRKLVKNTYIEIPVAGKHTGIQESYLVFCTPRFETAKGSEPDALCKEQLLKLTHQHALVFKKIFEELFTGIQCLSALSEFLPVVIQAPAQVPETEKIPLKVNVQVLGAVARLMYESRAVEITNKSQFCRLVAGMFSTPRQQKISAGSLKNHFDTIDPEIMARVCAALGKLLKKSRRFINLR